MSIEQIIILFFLLLTLSCNKEEHCNCDDEIFNLENPDSLICNEEYLVYNALLQDASRRNIAVINQSTKNSMAYDLNELYVLHNVDSSAYLNFEAVNSGIYYLDQERFFNHKYIKMLSKNAMKYYFQNPEIVYPWDCFFYCYPKSTGLISLSRVGFSTDSKYALVVISYSSPTKAASITNCLEKDSLSWKVIWTGGLATGGS